MQITKLEDTSWAHRYINMTKLAHPTCTLGRKTLIYVHTQAKFFLETRFYLDAAKSSFNQVYERSVPAL